MSYMLDISIPLPDRFPSAWVFSRSGRSPSANHSASNCRDARCDQPHAGLIFGSTLYLGTPFPGSGVPEKISSMIRRQGHERDLVKIYSKSTIDCQGWNMCWIIETSLKRCLGSKIWFERVRIECSHPEHLTGQS